MAITFKTVSSNFKTGFTDLTKGKVIKTYNSDGSFTYEKTDSNMNTLFNGFISSWSNSSGQIDETTGLPTSTTPKYTDPFNDDKKGLSAKIDEVTKKITDFGQILFDDIDMDPIAENLNFMMLNSYATQSKEFQHYNEKNADQKALDAAGTKYVQYTWTNHWDYYYTRGHLYDLLPALTKGDYLKNSITGIYNSIAKKMAEYVAEFKKQKTSLQSQLAQMQMSDDGGGSGNIAGEYGDGNMIPSVGTSTSSTPKTIQELFWTSRWSGFVSFVQNQAKALEQVGKDVLAMTNLVRTIKEVFYDYAMKLANTTNFITMESDISQENQKPINDTWKEIGVDTFNIHNPSKDIGEGYTHYLNACKKWDQIWEDREDIKLMYDITIKETDRVMLLNKLASDEVLTSLDYWDQSWDWYQQVTKFREKYQV